MPTLIEIADKLAIKFIQADNKKRTLRQMVNEINSLVYTSTKLPADHQTKISVVQVIHEMLSGKRPLLSDNGPSDNLRKEHIKLFAEMMHKHFAPTDVQDPGQPR